MLRKPGKKGSIIAVLDIPDCIRPEIATGEKGPPANWTGSRVKNAPDRGSINQHLSRIEGDLMQLWRDHKHADRDTILSLAKQVVKGGASSEKKRMRGCEEIHCPIFSGKGKHHSKDVQKHPEEVGSL